MATSVPKHENSHNSASTCQKEGTDRLNFSDLTRFIKPFDGDRGKLSSFIRNCQNALDIIQPNQFQILFKFILSQLEGKAEAVCSLKMFDNWTDLKNFLKINFGESKHRNHLLLDLQNCKIKHNESVLDYSTRLETHLTRLQTDISHSTSNENELTGRLASTEDLALHTFLLGLPPHISNILRCRDTSNLTEAINLAIQEEKFYNFVQSSQPKTPMAAKPNCRTCGKAGHSERSCYYSNKHRPVNNVSYSSNLNVSQPFQSAPQNSQPFSTSGNPIICGYCKSVGHHITQCRKRQYNNSNRQRSNIPLNKVQVHNLNSNDDQESNQDFHKNIFLD